MYMAKFEKRMRCPVCFSREIDVLMISDNKDGFYCIKCGFTGRESEVRGMYKDIQKKYAWMTKRLTLDDQMKM